MEVKEKQWKDIWDNRVDHIEHKDYSELLRLNGYDNIRSQLRPNNLQVAQEYYWKILNIKPLDSIFEVGCGSGAFLYSLWRDHHKIGGLDFSNNLLKIAKATLDGGSFEQGAAANLKITPKYDHVLSFSVFFYFPNLEYAEKVLLKMLEKAEKTVSLYELPDHYHKIKCEAMRRESIGPTYDEDYKGLQHLYFEKQWFIDFAYKHDLHLTIFDQMIPDYESGKYRFCVVLKENRTENK